jgi:hypothetical protein
MPDKYWVGGTGTWSGTNTANWSLLSGGPGGAAVPIAGEDIYFDANSGTGTVTYTGSGIAAGVVYGALSFRGITGTSNFAGTITGGGVAFSVSRNFTLSPSMTNTAWTTTITFSGTNVGNTITFNGKSYAGNMVFSASNDTASWTLADNFRLFRSGGTTSLTLTRGSVTASGTVEASQFIVTATANFTRVFTVSSLTITGTAGVINQSGSGTLINGINIAVTNAYITNNTAATKQIVTTSPNFVITNLYLQGSVGLTGNISPYNYNINASGSGFLGNVYFENTQANCSINIGSTTFNGSLDFSFVGVTPNITISSGSTISGNLTFPSLPYSYTDSNGTFTFFGTTNSEIRAYGANFAAMVVNKTSGANVTIKNTGTINFKSVRIDNGYLVLENDISTGILTSTTNNLRGLNQGNKKITLNGDSTVFYSTGGWKIINTDLFTYTSLSGAIIDIVPSNSSDAQNYEFESDQIFYSNVDLRINPNAFIYIKGSQEFNLIETVLAKTSTNGYLKFQSATSTYLVSDFKVNGSYDSSTNTIYRLRVEATSTTPHTFGTARATAITPVNFLTLKNVNTDVTQAYPTNTRFIASCNSINAGGNTGWYFIKCSKLPMLGVG